MIKHQVISALLRAACTGLTLAACIAVAILAPAFTVWGP